MTTVFLADVLGEGAVPSLQPLPQSKPSALPSLLGPPSSTGSTPGRSGREGACAPQPAINAAQMKYAVISLNLMTIFSSMPQVGI